MLTRSFVSVGVALLVILELPKSTLPTCAGFVTAPSGLVSAAVVGVIVMDWSPFWITNGSLPLPVIPFMLVKVSANFTTKPFASVVGSFSTRMFTPLSVAGVVALGVKFFAPFTVNVVPNARSTFCPSSPVKVNGFAAISFTVLIRVSNLETAAPTLLTVSVPPVASSFVMLYVGCVNAPLASTPALPPRAFAISCLAVCNWPPFTASLDLSAIVPLAMLDNFVPVAPSAVVVDPSGFTKRACTVVAGCALFNTLPSLSTAVAG